MIRRHSSGSRPPVGAMPISSVFGRSGSASASSSVATAGMSLPGTHSPMLWPAIDESRTAQIGSVP